MASGAGAAGGARRRLACRSKLALQRLEGIRRADAARHEPGNSPSRSPTVVRDYIEQRFDVIATQRTTEEFLHDLLRILECSARAPPRAAGGISAAMRPRQVRRACRSRCRTWNRCIQSALARFVLRDRPSATRRMIRFLQPEWFWLLAAAARHAVARAARTRSPPSNIPTSVSREKSRAAAAAGSAVGLAAADRRRRL